MDADDLIARLIQHRTDGGAALIDVYALKSAVADSDDGGAESVCSGL